MLDTIVQDARYAVRVLRKNPVFTMVAVAVIAVGIGAVSAIYTVADAAILRPVPGVRDLSHVTTIERTAVQGGGRQSVSYPYYQYLKQHSHAMSGISAWDMLALTVSNGGAGTTVQGNLVSGNYFTTLGVHAALGRFFARDEDSIPDARPVIVLSHEFWQRQFGSDSSIIGHQLLVNGRQFSVIGVAQPGFDGLFPAIRIDVWVPMMMQTTVVPGGDLLHDVNSGWLQLVGRLTDGVSRPTASAELTHLTQQYAASEEAPLPRGIPTFTAVTLRDLSGLPGDVARPVLAFFVVLLLLSALVLLIASVNVTGMLLVRAVARRREIAVRLALGAGARRLLAQLLTESVVLFAMGGTLGLALAVVGTRLLARIPLPANVPLALDLSLQPHTLLLTLGVALATGIVFGLLPATRAARADLNTSLRGDTAGSGHSRSRLRTVLVAAQLAASLLLLTVSGLFVKALARGHAVNPGYDIDHIATAAFDVSRSGYDSTRAQLFTQQLTQRLRTIPGVTAVGWSRNLPLAMNSSEFGLNIPGYRSPRGDDELNAGFATVDAGYFDVLHLPVIDGRAIRVTDDANAPPVTVISHDFAETVWPGQEAVGKTLQVGGHTTTVVGVTPDTKFSNLSDPVEPFMYIPLAQDWTSGISVMVRTTGDPQALVAPIRQAVRTLDATLPTPTVISLEQSAAIVLLPQRVAAIVTSALGFAGLLLSIIGLYGVVAFSAAQRTREMGIRQALGATRANVMQLVVGEGMRVVMIGVVIGLLLAILATRALQPFLFGVSPLDAGILAAGVLVLASAALLASWIPARRAARIDPMAALREE